MRTLNPDGSNSEPPYTRPSPPPNPPQTAPDRTMVAYAAQALAEIARDHVAYLRRSDEGSAAKALEGVIRDAEQVLTDGR